MATAYEHPQSARPRALVVDDSLIARYVLSGQLVQLGFDVDSANSAESALQRIDARLPDIVFMDHLLPGMDGLEAVRQLRSQAKTSAVPVVMYTSEESAAFAAKAHAAGASDIFFKSAGHERLDAIVRRLKLVASETPRPKTDKTYTEIRPRAEASQAARLVRLAGDQTDFGDILGRRLDSHHAKLRQDLLAEFAILERFQEKTRNELFARVSVLSQQTAQGLRRGFAEQSAADERGQRRATRHAWAMGTAFALLIVALAGSTWVTLRRIESLSTQYASSQADFAEQASELEMLESRLAADRPLARPSRALNEPLGDSESASVAPTLSAAEALVGEMQSMGILGPIRIETRAGSFCVRSTADGFHVEGDNLGLEYCEYLPIRSR